MINIRENIEPKLIESGTFNYFYNLSKNAPKENKDSFINTSNLYKHIKVYVLSYLYNNYKLVIIIILITILLYIRYRDKQRKKKIYINKINYDIDNEETSFEY